MTMDPRRRSYPKRWRNFEDLGAIVAGPELRVIEQRNVWEEEDRKEGSVETEDFNGLDLNF